VALAYLATEAAKEEEARAALLGELRRLAVDGFGEKELALAKSSFAGSAKIDMQANAALRDELARDAIFGMGLGSLAKRLGIAEATTLEQLRATAGKYFGAERFATAVLRGKPAAAPDPPAKAN
jgi:predicted Zn-dependent peptidase